MKQKLGTRWEHAGAGRELAHGVARLERRFVRLPLEHNVAWFDWFAADVTPDWRVLAVIATGEPIPVKPDRLDDTLQLVVRRVLDVVDCVKELRFEDREPALDVD